ncbi:MAG: class I SAM-dependent methyltransferase [Nitrospira sp.]|nr:class I SAM-dependent methyltransferase [Nitrospira sp.]
MERFLLIVLAAGITAVLILLAYGLLKIRDFQRHVYRSLGDRLPRLIAQELNTQLLTHFRQTEALAGLLMELGFTRSLPATRGWAASPDFLRELARHAAQARPHVIAECGSGVSTLILARCAQMNRIGHVYSLEHLAEHAEATRAELARHGLTEWATVLTAPLRSYELHGHSYAWYSTDQLPALELDMLVIDGPPIDTGHLARYPAGPLLFEHLSASAVVFLDDADRPDERTILQRWADEFPEFKHENRWCEKGCAVLRKQAVQR